MCVYEVLRLVVLPAALSPLLSTGIIRIIALLLQSWEIEHGHTSKATTSVTAA